MRIGAYTLQKKIGAGGMAEVWLAHGPRGVCVLKLPHHQLTDNPEFVRMFLDEAALLAQLHHPNIAQIFDLGQADGRYFLAMEYVPGFDLMTISVDHEQQGELMAPTLAARIVADVASALHSAHEAKDSKGEPLHIIHRDISPHNVLLSTKGVVKLIDFGVAKANRSRHRTQAGLVKGKYPYMSPEQITGQLIDRRVDVYALGLLLYELLTNVRAIAGETEVDQITNARDGLIRPIEQLRANTPVPLRQILGGCLHIDVEGRYPTALAVKEDLEKFLTLERHTVGQEDLLRLFRGVAADVGGVVDESLSSRPTEEETRVPSQPAVVAPEQPLKPEQIDESGYSSTLPSMKSLDAAPETISVPLATEPAPKKSPLPFVLGAIAVAAALALLLLKPWDRPIAVPVVDAGMPAVAIVGAVDHFDFPEPDAAVDEVKAMGRLAVTAFAPMEVSIDGERIGVTPLRLELNVGEHSVQLQGRNFERVYPVNVVVDEEQTIDVPAPARPKSRGKGTIHFIATPFCTFTLDGRVINPTPLSEVRSDALEGRHQVECSLAPPSVEKKIVKKQTVTVVTDQTIDVSFQLP